MDGVLRCTRYAFGPNRLHYCGPDANREIEAYMHERVNDPGLVALLQDFKTMYPYLQLIAAANQIADPFDGRVVEAYWLGNELLDVVEKQQLYSHLTDVQKLQRRLKAKLFEQVVGAVAGGAVPHHSFHVFDIWMRTGHMEREHTLASLEACRVSWGKVTAVAGPAITASAKRLQLKDGKLVLGQPETRTIYRKLESESDIEQLQPGQIVSIHWDVPCEVLTPLQAQWLERYTLKHINLANRVL